MPDTILDGEIAVLGTDGASDFAALRTRLGRSAAAARSAAATTPATYFAFDVLWHNGTDLRTRPLSHRLHVLESLCLSGTISRVDSFAGSLELASVIERPTR